MKTLSLAVLALGLSIFIYSCSKEDSNKTVPVQFLLTDNPVAYDSVNIHIKGMRVKMQDDSTSWIDVNAKDTTVNLLDLQNGVTMVIAQAEIPDGRLKEVRFILDSDSYVVVNGVRHELETPSAEHAGLKIKIDKDLNESLNTFTLDFDAAESVKELNGSYKLHPVIRLK